MVLQSGKSSFPWIIQVAAKTSMVKGESVSTLLRSSMLLCLKLKFLSARLAEYLNGVAREFFPSSFTVE